MSDPGWSTYEPATHASARAEGDTTVESAEKPPQRGMRFAIGVVVLVVLGLVGVFVAMGLARQGADAGRNAAGEVDLAVLEGDFLADALAEAAEIEQGDPFDVMVAEYGVTLAYFDAERGQRRDLSIDLKGTADYRIRVSSDVEPNFAPFTFPVADIDAGVLRDLTEQAVAESEDPSGFYLSIDVPHQAQQPEVVVRVSSNGDDGDGVRLTAALDGSGVSVD